MVHSRTLTGIQAGRHMAAQQTRLVLGLTGPIGGGTSTVAEILEKEDAFHRGRLSAPIKKEFRSIYKLKRNQKIESEPDWRKKLQDIGDDGRRKSLDYWIKKVLKDVPEGPDVVIDGIRNLGEVDYLRQKFPKFFLLAILASKEIRWERVKDDYGGNLAQFERDDRRDAEEDFDHGQQVTKCVLEADYVFLNDKADIGSSEVRNRKLWDGLKNPVALIRGMPRSSQLHPTEHEVHMATAYAQAHGSRCLK